MITTTLRKLLLAKCHNRTIFKSLRTRDVLHEPNSTLATATEDDLLVRGHQSKEAGQDIGAARGPSPIRRGQRGGQGRAARTLCS